MVLKPVVNNVINYLSTGAGFPPSTVVCTFLSPASERPWTSPRFAFARCQLAAEICIVWTWRKMLWAPMDCWLSPGAAFRGRSQGGVLGQILRCRPGVLGALILRLTSGMQKNTSIWVKIGYCVYYIYIYYI